MARETRAINLATDGLGCENLSRILSLFSMIISKMKMLRQMILEAPSSIILLWKCELEGGEAVRGGLVCQLPHSLTMGPWDNLLTSLLLSFFICDVRT